MGSHGKNADGCLYQRSAAFITPKIYYNEAGKQKVVELDTARFTGDTNAGQSFCKDWSCADSGINFFTMTTGGARQGKPDQECYHGQMFAFNAENETLIFTSKDYILNRYAYTNIFVSPMQFNLLP